MFRRYILQMHSAPTGRQLAFQLWGAAIVLVGLVTLVAALLPHPPSWPLLMASTLLCFVAAIPWICIDGRHNSRDR